MKPTVMKMSRNVQFSRTMELDDLKSLFWGYIDGVLEELLKSSTFDLHYLMFLFYSGVKTYLLYSITDPKEPPLSRGYIETPVGAGTIEISVVAGGVDFSTMENAFVKHALKL